MSVEEGISARCIANEKFILLSSIPQRYFLEAFLLLPPPSSFLQSTIIIQKEGNIHDRQGERERGKGEKNEVAKKEKKNYIKTVQLNVVTSQMICIILISSFRDSLSQI